MLEPLVVTRVAHSCHLIQFGGLTVLTDPWFSQKTFYYPASRSPFSRRRCLTWTPW